MRLRAMAIVGVLAMAGCGGGEEDGEAADVVRPSEPVLCPATDGAPLEQDAAREAFDAREILGLSLADAEARAEQRDCTVRVVVRDGEELAQTMDLRTERINVAVRDGTVVELRGIG